MLPLTAGFVLVGGRSSRMRTNKARLTFHARALVEIVAQQVAQAAGSVTLVGDPDAFTDLAFQRLADRQPGFGPLSGLETALNYSCAEINLVTSCDIPDVKLIDLTRLLQAASENKALCTIIRDAHGHRHPLCAVYRRQALPLVRQALESRRLRLLDLVEELKAEELRINSVLHNLNTPEQWAAWQAAQPVS
jgi:molybdopterin-guanine dinucleotide biosynthesis protein A